MNKKIFIKNEKGITLTALIIYIILISIVVGIFSIVVEFFYKNIKMIKEDVIYSSEFDRFNSNMVSDVKKNKNVLVDNVNKTIIFEDGTTYKYDDVEDCLYRGSVKIAQKVRGFDISLKKKAINEVEKQTITVTIKIGNKRISTNKMQYTLKYW